MMKIWDELPYLDQVEWHTKVIPLLEYIAANLGKLYKKDEE